MGLLAAVAENLATIRDYHAGRTRIRVVDLNVTGRCPLDCLMCECRSLDHHKDWTTEELRVLAEDIAREGVQGVFVGGGEPFVRRDISEVLAGFARVGLSVSTITSGSVPHAFDDARLADLDEHVADIDLSLDSVVPEEHNAIRNSPHAHRMARETLERLVGLERTRRSLKAVITRLNFRRLDELVPLAAQHRFESVVFQPVTDAPNYPPLAAKTGKPELLLVPEEIPELERTLRRAAARARELGVVTNAGVILRWVGRYFRNRAAGRPSYEGLVNKFYCLMACERISIGHDGRVSICAILPTEDSVKRTGVHDVLTTPHPLREQIRRGQLTETCGKCFCGLDGNVTFSGRANPIRNFPQAVTDVGERVWERMKGGGK